MAIPVQEGQIDNFVLTVARTVGEAQIIVAATNLAGICLNGGAIGDTVPIAIGNVWECKAETGVAWNRGDKLYAVGTAVGGSGTVTKTSAGNTPLGFAWEAKLSASAIGKVRLMGGAVI